MEKTFAYFDVRELNENEGTQYTRLARTVAYFISHLNDIGNVTNVKFAVADWWDKQEIDRIYRVKRVLSKLNSISDFELISPSKTIEKDGLLETAIGIRGLKFEELFENALLTLIVGLSDLADVDIDFYHVIVVEGNHTERNTAIRISRYFFERVKTSIETDQEFTDDDISRLYPINIEKELLEALPQICMKDTEEVSTINKVIANILNYLWNLCEVRKRLSKEEKNEISWRIELETRYKDALERQAKIIEKEASPDISKKYKKLIKEVVNSNKILTVDTFEKCFSELSL